MRGRVKGITAAAVSATLVTAGVFAFAASSAPQTAHAAAGNPGTPSAATTVYQEDFENGVGNTPVSLTAYTGASGQKYTADNGWLTNCNGQVRNFNTPSTTSGNCQLEGDAARLNQLAYALGVHAGSSTPATNHAVTAYTENNPGANATEFQTVTNIPLASSSGRFLTFSVDTAAVNCPPVASAPLYQFAFLNQTGAATNVGGQLNACASGQTINVPASGSAPANTANVGTYTSNGSLLFSGSSLGIRMQNANGSGAGNDAAFDNIKILDVTPQLDKGFTPTNIEAGKTSTLTFTVTNTSELAAKNGWSFTDSLPSGLTVASSTTGGTCDATTAATAGGTSIAVTAGNLTAGETSCTITVQVTSSTPGSYTNGPDNVTETGLNPPGDTTLTVTEPPAWTCSAFGYLFQAPGAGEPTGIYQVDLVSGASSQIGTVPDTVNAVGYNTLDNYMYAWDNNLGSIVQIASDGTLTQVTTTGITNSTGFQVGDFDNAGHLWLMYGGNGTGAWDEVDLAPGSSTYGTVLDSGTTNRPATLAALPSDWAYVNGAFYGAEGAASGTGLAHLVKFDPTTGATSDLGTLAGTNGEDATWGAAYADAAGNVYFSNNTSGHIIRVVPATRATISLSNGPSSAGNDGARCANAPIPTITVTKTVAGRVQAADQFTVGLNDAGGKTLTTATTSGTATTASTTDWPVSQNATYTITDAMAADSPDALSAYSATVVCTDTTTGDTVTTGGTTGAWTLPVTTTDAYTCVVTNGPATPSYTVSKTASASSVQQGGTITYTVTVKNTGTVPYTADNQASFTDDLSKVLDDAEYNGDASGGATVSGSTLSWSGPLEVGATQTITYSVTVDDPDTGDHELGNTVIPTGPGGGCDTDGTCTTTTPVGSYTVAKSASPSGDVAPGQKVTYTVIVTNTGATDYTADSPATFTDDLSKVLDDASYDNDASNGATVSGNTLSWSGALKAGATTTVTYSVTVNSPDTGDGTLTNSVVPGDGGGCDPNATCTTTDLVHSYTVAKTSSATGDVHPGDTVTYTVTVTNTGSAAYTASDRASFSDDLSKVLDDGTYVAGSATNGATVSGTTLSWSGPLALGATETITYQVNVGPAGTGDGTLTNSVTADPGNGGSCTTADDCTTTNPVQAFSVVKQADATEVTPGDTVDYTITVTNTGAAAYTAGDPATFTDDLSRVLDDASYNNDATAGATVSDGTLSWSGPLAVGATETITYSVTVNSPDTGDKHLDNTVVTPTGGGGDCPAGTDDADCTANVPGGSYTVAKTASSSTAAPGDTITYTVTVINTGNIDYTKAKPASFTDDLTNVLDDATYNKDASNGAKVDGNSLSWSGPLAVGATETITYSVAVNTPDAGNHKLVNAVVPTSPGGGCDTAGDCMTTTGVATYTVTKTVSTTGEVKPGAKVDYTVTVTNTGQVPYTDAKPASFADNMSDVLDDAAYNGDATHGANLSGNTLTWSGPLGIGETVKITYSVTVDDPDTGNHRLLNTVDPTVAGGGCDPAGSCETTTGIISPQAPVVAVNTGGYTVDQQPVWERLLPFGGLSAALLALGAAMVFWMRRKGSQQE